MARLPLGLEAKAYINFGTTAAPIWREITVIKDVTLNLEKGEADVTTRGADGWEQIKATLKKASIDFNTIWLDAEDESDLTDADLMIFEELMEAFLDDNKTLEMMFLSGSFYKKGSRGLKATFDIFKFTRDEKLTEALGMSGTAKPTYGKLKPEWITVAEDSTPPEIAKTSKAKAGKTSLPDQAIA